MSSHDPGPSHENSTSSNNDIDSVQYPCGICTCSCEVEYGQKAIQCDQCDVWIHKNCAVVSDHIYQIYQDHSNLSWVCIKCGLPNVGPSLFDTYHFCSENSFSVLSDETEENLTDQESFKPMASSTPNKPSSDKTNSSSPTKSSGDKAMPSTSGQRNRLPKLKTMVINCDGLKGEKGRLSFQAALVDHSPDLILGCESKLDSTIPTFSVFLEGYNVIRKDRTKNGGGVFIAVRDTLISVDKPQFDAPCELIWSCLEFANAGKVYIGSFYRPPKHTSAGFEPVNHLFDSISKVMQEIKNNRSNIPVCGDFNFPDIDWEDNQTKEASRYKKIHNDFPDHKMFSI